MGSAKLSLDVGRIQLRIENYKEELDKAIEALVEYHAAAGVRDMKLNAPWTDRTSAARNGLHTVVEKSPGHYTVIFAHTVHYGIWLEVKFSGRDSVIMPTVLDHGQGLIEDLKELIR